MLGTLVTAEITEIHSGSHRASGSDDGDELERSDEGWLDDGASAGTPC
jgi:hypothetical protein